MPCCGPSEQRPEVGVPKLKLPPSALAKVIKQITSAGVEVAKLTSSGQPRQKAIVLDRRMELYTFLPSSKAFEDRQHLVSNIVTIVVGNEVTKKLADNHFDDSTYCFAFILADGSDVNFVCNDEVQRDQLVDLFSFLVRRKKVMLDESPHRVRLMSMWLKADNDGNGRLTFDELARALADLNVNMERSTMRKLFMGVDKDGSGTLDFEEFVEFFDDLTLRPELKPLFQKYAGESGDEFALEPEEFQAFLHRCQNENVSSAVAEGLCRRFGEGQPAMSFNDFCRYLVSPSENPALKPSHVPAFEEMDRPLHQYNMLTSTSADVRSTASIKAVLRHGVRVLHLKLTDHDGRPTLSANKSLSLEAVFRSVNEAAFEGSDAPVILALAGSWRNVRAATAVAKRYLSRRSVLTVTALEKNPQPCLCPSTIANKIVLVGFVEPENQPDMWATDELGVIRGISTAAAADELEAFATGVPFEMRHGGNNAMLQVTDSQLRQHGDAIRKWALNGLVMADAKFHSYQDTLRAGIQLCPAQYTVWSEHVASMSNYFHMNGAKGCRLRPASILNPAIIDEDGNEELPPVTKLSVRVLLGTQIPQSKVDAGGRDIVDPFVRVSIIGEKRDQEANTTGNTEYISDNGFTPVWDENFEFGFRYADQAFLRLKLFDYNSTENHEIAEAYLPLTSLRQGYRAVAFRTTEGQKLPHTSIVCHFRFHGQPPTVAALIPTIADAPSPPMAVTPQAQTAKSREASVATAQDEPAMADPAPAIISPLSPGHTQEAVETSKTQETEAASAGPSGDTETQPAEDSQPPEEAPSQAAGEPQEPVSDSDPAVQAVVNQPPVEVEAEAAMQPSEPEAQQEQVPAEEQATLSPEPSGDFGVQGGGKKTKKNQKKQ